MYWSDLTDKITAYVDGVLTVGSYVCKYRVTKYPGFTAFALNYYKNIPEDWTETALMLCKEKDFWDLIYALKGWLERHGAKKESKLPNEPVIYLHGELRPESLLLSNNSTNTSLNDTQSTKPSSVIEVKKPQKSPAFTIAPKEITLKREALVKVELSDFKAKNKKNNGLVSTNPVTLFSKKQTKNEASHGEYSLQKRG